MIEKDEIQSIAPGERLYAPDTIRLFEQIRQKLKAQDVEEFEPLGRAFHVPG